MLRRQQKEQRACCLTQLRILHPGLSAYHPPTYPVVPHTSVWAGCLLFWQHCLDSLRAKLAVAIADLLIQSLCNRGLTVWLCPAANVCVVRFSLLPLFFLWCGL